jgi:hypothetical protein
VKPEVLVGKIRRRRRSARAEPPRPPNVRNWVVYVGLGLLVGGLMLSGFLLDQPETLPLPPLAQATDVRSTIWESPDSMQIEVAWDLTLSEPEGLPDSIRVRVIRDPADTTTMTHHGSGLSDTAYLPASKPGQTVKGFSCVAAQHGAELPLEEVCTPWQYVRPVASASAGTGPVVRQIVVQPNGLQVDPDVDGRCAEWQRTHPPDSVWIEVNLTAVPECTGPNNKPIVAQFCAFAVLPDGRRAKTTNSSNSRYCDELFAEWIRERYS